MATASVEPSWTEQYEPMGAEGIDQLADNPLIVPWRCKIAATSHRSLQDHEAENMIHSVGFRPLEGPVAEITYANSPS